MDEVAGHLHMALSLADSSGMAPLAARCRADLGRIGRMLDGARLQAGTRVESRKVLAGSRDACQSVTVSGRVT